MLFIFYFLSVSLGADNHIFPPVHNDIGYKEQVAIFIPGGAVPIEFYNLTVQSIQKQTHVKLWVGIPNFANTENLCNPLSEGPFGVHKKVQATLDSIVQQAGRSFSNADIWIFGHSLGSACAQIYFNQGYAGFALFGGCIPNEVGFDKVKERVMCFTGELDLGMTPTLMSYMLDNLDDLAARTSFDDALAFRPIGLYPGMCHLDVCPGYESVDSHFTSEITTDEAMNVIGEISAAFVEYDGSITYKIIYEKYYNYAINILKPYREIAAIQNSTWCGEYAQKEVAHLDDVTWARTTLIQNFVTVDDPFTIEHCHTNCTLGDDGTLTLNVSSMAEYNVGRSIQVNLGVGTMSLSAADLACKMVSRDKVGEVLGQTWENDRTCKDINQIAIDTAMSYLQQYGYQQSTYNRFRRIGKPFKLIDDRSITIGPQWCITKASFDIKDDCVEFKSIRLLSPVTSSIYPGNFYCKLLSPARVVEWAMARGLPHNVSSVTGY